jgi:hypothetical protein
MTNSLNVPRGAKQYVACQAATVFILWFAWQFALRFLGTFSAVMIMNLGCIGGLMGTRLLSGETRAYIKENRPPFRRYLFGVFVWVLPVMALLQIALAAYVNRALLWIVSGVAIVIGGACLLNDWAEARELGARLPNQSSEPTLASVTPPAGQESRPR